MGLKQVFFAAHVAVWFGLARRLKGGPNTPCVKTILSNNVLRESSQVPRIVPGCFKLHFLI